MLLTRLHVYYPILLASCLIALSHQAQGKDVLIFFKDDINGFGLSADEKKPYLALIDSIDALKSKREYSDKYAFYEGRMSCWDDYFSDDRNSDCQTIGRDNNNRDNPTPPKYDITIRFNRPDIVILNFFEIWQGREIKPLRIGYKINVRNEFDREELIDEIEYFLTYQKCRTELIIALFENGRTMGLPEAEAIVVSLKRSPFTKVDVKVSEKIVYHILEGNAVGGKYSSIINDSTQVAVDLNLNSDLEVDPIRVPNDYAKALKFLINDINDKISELLE